MSKKEKKPRDADEKKFPKKGTPEYLALAEAADRAWKANRTEEKRAANNTTRRAWQASWTKKKRAADNAYKRVWCANRTVDVHTSLEFCTLNESISCPAAGNPYPPPKTVSQPLAVM